MGLPSTVLTVAKAERSIIAEWRTWAKKRRSYTITDMQIFYFVWLRWLRMTKPKLLSFKCQGDQWQVVRVWLQHDEVLQVKLRRSQVWPWTMRKGTA